MKTQPEPELEGDLRHAIEIIRHRVHVVHETRDSVEFHVHDSGIDDGTDAAVRLAPVES